jgi:two-component system KDP operon response regulator KdpE
MVAMENSMDNKEAPILIIDDEPQMRRLLQVALSACGYRVAEAATGQDGLAQAATSRPGLIILDLTLPDLDGLDVIVQLREWTQAPIIILSVREREHDKIAALDSGADDYVTKPFGMGELLARIRNALRHAGSSDSEPLLTFGDLAIDLAQRLVTVNGREIRLTPTEYKLLKTMAEQAGKVLTHTYLLRAVWGSSCTEEVHYLRVFIKRLRGKIERNPSQPSHIITEPCVGYRFL